MSQSRESFSDYDGFVEKFKPKRTTDNCYTPPEVYAVVLDYVRGRLGVKEADVVRPFWPGGDYEALFDYQLDRHCSKTIGTNSPLRERRPIQPN